MTPEDHEIFGFSLEDIDWRVYIKYYNYGIQRYIIKQPTVEPSPTHSNLIMKRKKISYFTDIMWAIRHGKKVQVRTTQEVKQILLKNPEIKIAISLQVDKKLKKGKYKGMTREEVESVVYHKADQIMTEMCGQMKMSSIRSAAWFFHKVWRQLYDKLVIDRQQFNIVKEIYDNR